MLTLGGFRCDAPAKDPIIRIRHATVPRQHATATGAAETQLSPPLSPPAQSIHPKLPSRKGRETAPI